MTCSMRLFRTLSMPLYKRTLYLAFVGLLLLAYNATAQSAQSTSPAWDVAICSVKLLVGTTDFEGQIRYSVKTDSQGNVISVDERGKSPLFKVVDTQRFPPCIKDWRLSPVEDHVVTIGVATSFTDRKNNFIAISNKRQSLK